MSKVMFKQRLYAPNQKGTPAAIQGMLNYIATRDGVELNFNDEVKDRFVDYIATRPGVEKKEVQSHGLFGKIQGMDAQSDIEELSAARNYVNSIAKDKKSVYNAIMSLTGEDAKYKDITTRADWEKLLEEQIFEIARMMDIPARTLEWVAAVHMEKGHPHMHIMYWDREQKMGRDFIQPELTNDIRKKLIRNLFGEEMKDAYQKKDIEKKKLSSLLWGDNAQITNRKNVLHGMHPKAIFNTCTKPNRKYDFINRQSDGKSIRMDDIYNIYHKIKTEYPVGALKYKYVPEQIKKELDALSKKILDNDPKICRQFEKYMNAVREHAEFYGNKKNVKAHLADTEKKLYKEIGNKILNTIKEIKEKEPIGRKMAYTDKEQAYQMVLLRRAIYSLIFQNTANVEMQNMSCGGENREELSELELAERRRKRRDKGRGTK